MRTPVVVITGANNGIGFYITKSLLEDGFRVAAFDLTGENLSSLEGTYPNRLGFYRCDVTDAVQIRASVESVVQQWSRIDVLVNNACLAIFAPLGQRTLDDTRREFEVNYFGYLRMIEAVLPR